MMFETIVHLFVRLLTAYAALGFVFALYFVSVGVQKYDEQAQGAGWFFRVLISPGVASLWPLFAYRVLAGVKEPPVEKNPHR